MLMVSQGLLWLVVLLLAGAVVALARQVGVLHERIAPVGALALGQGPQPGKMAPSLTAPALDGRPVAIGGTRARLQLLFFVAPSCPVCKQLLPTARAFAAAEGIDLLLVGDGDAQQHREMAARHGIAEAAFVNSSGVGMAFRVGKLPYAVLIDAGGIVVAQGLVNTREHLESLLAVRETGFASVQDYLRSRTSAPPVFAETVSHGQ